MSPKGNFKITYVLEKEKKYISDNVAMGNVCTRADIYNSSVYLNLVSYNAFDIYDSVIVPRCSL